MGDHRMTIDQLYTGVYVVYAALAVLTGLVVWISRRIHKHQRAIEAIIRRAESQDRAWRCGEDQWGQFGRVRNFDGTYSYWEVPE